MARVVLPGYPHHVVHRGHNRAPVFVRDADYRFYLTTLKEWKLRLGCRVYAYCLMTNHVHLLVDPGDDAGHLGKLMKRIAGRYTRYVNRREQRSGTVWDGRYKSSLVETDRYLMACCRYIELNPVRAAMVAAPEAYRWSSHAARIGRADCPWLDEHPLYADLGESKDAREKRYREWVRASVPAEEWERIRAAARRGQLTGSTRLQAVVERRLGRRVAFRGPGRPRRRQKSDLSPP